MLDNGHNYCDRCGKEIPVNKSNPLMSDTLCEDCSKYLDEQISRLRKKKNEDSAPGRQRI